MQASNVHNAVHKVGHVTDMVTRCDKEMKAYLYQDSVVNVKSLAFHSDQASQSFVPNLASPYIH